MKTKEELKALKEEGKILNKKFRALSDDELTEVTGGQFDPDGGPGGYNLEDYLGGYNFGPCSERGCYTVSNVCLCPLCGKLRSDGVVYSCQDGPQRGLYPVPCN